MKILAIDTSSKICSVAVLEDTTVILEKHSEDEKTHSQKLMPMVDEILNATNLKLADFDFYACCTGPGSFTGVRIGVSTVKAFCDVTSVPIASVSSLESLAYNTINSNYKDDANFICSIIDAKNDNVYFGIFERNENVLLPVQELKAKNIDEAIEDLKNFHFKPILFVGDGAKKHQYHLLEFFKKATFVENTYNNQTAISVGIAGFYHYEKGNFGDSNSTLPLYLRKSQAERALEGEK